MGTRYAGWGIHVEHKLLDIFGRVISRGFKR
jgi:hypothetical protein